MSFKTLPTEVLQIVFSFTSWRDLQTIGLVCRRWAAAVESLLLARTCLNVSYRKGYKVYGPGIGGPGDTYHAVPPNTPIRLMDKKVLLNTSRSYTCLRVEWDNDKTGQNTAVLQAVLDICQQRFSVQRLDLRGPIDSVLADFFLKYRKLLENLTELHFEDFSTESAVGSATVELSLPKLKQLTWFESIFYYKFSTYTRFKVLPNGSTTTSRFCHFNFYKLHVTLHVPKLERLRIRYNEETMTTQVDLDMEFEKNCYLFLPSLYLKSCSKLLDVEINELTDLDQRLVNLSESFLQNLKILTMSKCKIQTIKKICEKCPNLEELFVDEPLEQQNNLMSSSLPFKISTVLSRSLKKLTLKQFYAPFTTEEAVFPELHCLCLRQMTYALGSNNVTLIAPKLTTLVTSRTAYDRLNIIHKDQIRTMVVDLKPDIHSIPPPPNITKLVLYQRDYQYGEEGKTIIQEYLNLHSNLRQLNVVGSWIYNRTQLNLKSLSNLEYLCATNFTCRLTDFHELTQLKSLILSYCSITTIPDDEEVKLSALEHMRMENVHFANIVNGACDELTWDHFPIHGNGRQAPVIKSKGVFSNGTPKCHLKLDLPKAFY